MRIDRVIECEVSRQPKQKVKATTFLIQNEFKLEGKPTIYKADYKFDSFSVQKEKVNCEYWVHKDE